MSKKLLFKRASLHFTNTTKLNEERRLGSSNLVYTVKDFKAMNVAERTKLKNVCIFKTGAIILLLVALTALLFFNGQSFALSKLSTISGPMLLIISCALLYMVVKLYFYVTSAVWLIKNMHI